MRHFIKFLIAMSLMLGANVASAAVLAKHLTLNNCADNQICVARIQYNFATDGGAVATYDVATAGPKIVIQNYWTKAVTSLTSAGAAVVQVGVTGDGQRFQGGTSYAGFTAGAASFPPLIEGTPNVMGVPYFLAAGNKILFQLSGAALTGGDLEFVIQYYKP